MRLKLVRIGNSRGIRIPKHLIEEARLQDELEVTVKDGGLLVRPARHPRDGWEESLAEMARNGDDGVDPGWELLPNEFDETEWTWPSIDSKST